MSVTVGPYTFQRVHYDADADVLYLATTDPPIEATDWDETPEGHALRFDADGNLVGLTIVGPKAIAAELGSVPISLPFRADLAAALA